MPTYIKAGLWHKDIRGVRGELNLDELIQSFIPTGGGSVTNVSSANSDIGVASGTTTPILTLNSGSGANQIVKRNGSGVIPDLASYELLSNKSTTTTLGTSNTLYPTQNAVKVYVDNLLSTIGLAAVLGISNSTNQMVIHSNNANARLYLLDDRTILDYSNGSNTTNINMDGINSIITATGEVSILSTTFKWNTKQVATIDDLALKAPLASPTFTGTITTPTIIVSGATVSTIAEFDGTKTLISATKSTAYNKDFGTGTTNVPAIGATLGNSLILGTDGTGKLVTLSTATYPTLAELAFVKGLTSSAQTQLTALLPVSGLTFAGTFALDLPAGKVYNDYTQTGNLTLATSSPTVLGNAEVKITANGNTLAAGAGWINVGSDSLSAVNGAVNRIWIYYNGTETRYSVKVN